MNEAEKKQVLLMLEESIGNINIDEISGKRNSIQKEFIRLFSKSRIRSMTKDEYISFFKMLNNLGERNLKYKKSMEMFEKTIEIINNLLYGNDHIEIRFNDIVTSKGGIPKMQKVSPTILLNLLKPDEFSIWSRHSQVCLEQLKLYPKEEKTSFTPYSKINEIQKIFAKELDVSLWTLDYIWKIIYDDKYHGM